MCIWNLPEHKRLCHYCSYPGKCENKSSPQPADKTFKAYLRAANTVFQTYILSPSRSRDAVWGRNFLSYRLYLDNVHMETIGRWIGKDRTTVIHSVAMVKSMLRYPQAYKEEYAKWIRFNELIQKHTKKP